MLISPSEIIIQSWQFYKKNWRALTPYMVLIFLPTVILECLGIMGLYISNIAPSLTLASKIIILLVLAATFVFDIWISVAFTRATKALILQEPDAHNWQSLFNGSSHLIWPSFYTAILMGLTVLAGLILFVVPGVIFTIWYGFANYGVMLDDKRGVAAMAFSKQLVVGRWWKIFTRLIISFALFMIIGSVVRYILVNPIALLPYSAFPLLIVQSVVSTIINVLLMPLMYSCGVLLYLSAKANPVEITPKV